MPGKRSSNQAGKYAARAFLIPAPQPRDDHSRFRQPPNGSNETTSLIVTNSISASTKAMPVRNAHS